MKALSDYDIKKTLLHIAKLTFPENKIPPFDLKLVNKENYRYHGIYYFPGKNKWGKYQIGKIEIHNLTRNPQYIISTAIHELAHHCDFMFRKTTDHSKKFYDIYAKLLKKTIELNYIDYSIARKATDVGDLYKLEKYYKEFSDKIMETATLNSDRIIIKIFKNFAEGKILKSRSYVYSKIEKCWTREINKSDGKVEVSNLKKFFKSEDIKIFKNVSDLNFDTKVTIRIKITKPEYQHLNLILKNSQSYKYNSEKKYWEKITLKIKQKREMEILTEHGINDLNSSIIII